MYVRITTRCNMSCDHCCYSCTEQGEDMPLDTFKECLKWGDEYISIGGGEPTIHPEFYHFLMLAIAECETPWLATNGKETEIALVLAKLARSGVISCDLSQDNYHEQIDSTVIQAFTKDTRPGEYISQGRNSDFRSIRNVNDKEINAGRCNFGTDGCPCEDFVVNPNGDIFQCGCDNSPKVGNIFDDNLEMPDMGCYKDMGND